MMSVLLPLVLLWSSFHSLQSMREFSPDIFDFRADKYIVVPLYILGLANRLRTMSSVYTISKVTKRKMIVIWVPNMDCNADFDQLFDAYDTDITVVKWKGEFNQQTVLTEIKAINKELHVSVLFQSPRKFFVNTAFNISATSSSKADLVFFWTASSHVPFDTSCDEYIRLKHQFYTRLRPVPAVLSAIRGLGQQVGLSHKLTQLLGDGHNGSDDNESAGGAGGNSDRSGQVVVGVHVRVHEEAFDWAVVPPGGGADGYNASTPNAHTPSDIAASTAVSGDDDSTTYSIKNSNYDLKTTNTNATPSAQMFDKSTPLEAVVAAMTDILLLHPTVLFVVASNSRTVKEHLLQTFNADRILTLFSPPEESMTSRNTTAGVQLALLELYLLGMTSDVILHSKGSSFAAEAAYLQSDKPLAVVDMTITTMRSPVQHDQKDTHNYTSSYSLPVNIYKQDVRLSFCGLDDYYNAAVEKHFEIDVPLSVHSEKQQRSQVCYRDDTGDSKQGGRLLCTYLQKLHSCEWAQTLWGVGNLYCLDPDANDNKNSGGDSKTMIRRKDTFDNTSDICLATDFLGGAQSSSTVQGDLQRLPPNICMLTDSRGY